MGRHRRAGSESAQPVEPVVAPEAGRHRGDRRRSRVAPVRTGLLGASAAMAVGAVAFSAGLVPGSAPDRVVTDASSSHEEVQPNGAPKLVTQSVAPSQPEEGSPSAKASDTAKKKDTDTQEKPASPSAEPTRTAESPKTASPSASKSSSSPSASKSSSPSASEEEKSPSAEPSRPLVADGNPSETAAEAEVLSLVNSERQAAGCSPLTADPELASLAGEFSEDMAEQGFFSHNSPDGSTPWDRAEAAGVDNLGGENIARGQADAQAVMDAWMDSPGHRANILNCQFKTLGVGAHFASGGPWWTQNFGY